MSDCIHCDIHELLEVAYKTEKSILRRSLQR